MNFKERRQILGASFIIGAEMLVVSGLLWGIEPPRKGMASLGCLVLGLTLTGFAIQTTVWWGKCGMLDEQRRDSASLGGNKPER